MRFSSLDEMGSNLLFDFRTTSFATILCPTPASPKRSLSTTRTATKESEPISLQKSRQLKLKSRSFLWKRDLPLQKKKVRTIDFTLYIVNFRL